MPYLHSLPMEIGRYTVVAFAGAGSGAEVYRANLAGTMGFTKRVALKLLPAPPTGINARQVQALTNEARIGGRLQHPNVCEVYEFGSADGYYYISMEFVDGMHLSDALKVCKQSQTPIPEGLVLDIATQVCRGLDHAHRVVDESGQVHPLVHRDLKPANIMLSTTGLVKLMDFGIAKTDFNVFQTSEGLTRGTPMYMSPEQVRGDPLGPPSDLFSLGVILYELLMGRRLFQPAEGEGLVELMERISSEDVSDDLYLLGARHPVFHGVVSRCLQLHSSNRFASALETLAHLESMRDQVAFGRSVAAFVAELQAAQASHRQRPKGSGRRSTDSSPSVQSLPSDAAESMGNFTHSFFTLPFPSLATPGVAAEAYPSEDTQSVNVEVLESREDWNADVSAEDPPPGKP